MKLITHNSHLNALPESALKTYITSRFNQLSEDSDVPPTIFVHDPFDILDSPEFIFLGESGIYSDIFDTNHPGDSGFRYVFEWISFDPIVPVYEMLYLEGDLGYYFIFGPEVVEADLKLKALIYSQPLSEPQPLY